MCKQFIVEYDRYGTKCYTFYYSVLKKKLAQYLEVNPRTIVKGYHKNSSGETWSIFILNMNINVFFDKTDGHDLHILRDFYKGKNILHMWINYELLQMLNLIEN